MEDSLKPSFLKGAWYPIGRSKKIIKDHLYKTKICDLPITFGRAGDPFALVDSCPHRGLPLSYGSIKNNEIQCKYHGWRFNASNGNCESIPCLTKSQRKLGTENKIKAHSLPCIDRGGLTWVYIAFKKETPESRIPSIPEIFNRDPDVYIERVFKADIDQSMIGLMDPAHLPFVHTSWWWKKISPENFRLKTKEFEPNERGFTLKKHVIENPGKPYKILGEPVETEIRLELPGLRLELIQGSRQAACSITALAPIDSHTTRVHQCLYWSSPWLLPLKPILTKLGGIFLDQDRVIVEQQQEGLQHNPSLTLIDGADTQAKWYYRLKREMERCQREGSDFKNPINPAVLEWMC
jgi:phenylpropionate dioxygenase-like ring-hydroxylating dioxygenase large terminal subunit